MPNYSRQIGANITGITALRLVEKATITTIATYDGATAISTPLAIADTTKVHSFMQLNGSGQLSYSQEATDAGTVYSYKIAWSYPKNRKEVNALLDALKSAYFVVAIADGNISYMLLGTPTTPFEVVGAFNAADATYSFEATGSSLTPPQFITGIFNPTLYTGGTGTI